LANEQSFMSLGLAVWMTIPGLVLMPLPMLVAVKAKGLLAFCLLLDTFSPVYL